MNRERAKELLPILQAFAEGKDIQCWQERKDKWETIKDPDVFAWASSRWRIKPEPREFWIHKSIQNMYAHNSEIEARQGAFDGAGIATGSTIIHVREVLDDE
jgi:hypothetical protein